MWNKTITLLILICLLATPWAMANSMEESLTKTVIPVELHGDGMLLEAFLAHLSAQSGIRILAVPEAAKTKITLHIPANQTLGQILSSLTNQYGLTYLTKGLQGIVVFHDARHDIAPHAAALYKTGLVQERAQAVMATPSPSFPYPSGGYFNTEEYKRLQDNAYQPATAAPLSTFSIDVDTASYSNVRRFINSGRLPPADAVRTEEMINYFTYDYPQPQGEHPFSLITEVAPCPWNPAHQLVLVGLQGKKLPPQELPPSNLVFLIDVSGSMNSPNKLPLLKTAFKLLVNQLRDEDRVSIVVYASQTGTVLESTPGSEKEKIIQAIDNLQAGGSTAGGAGIQLAYKIAKENLITAGNNRVILATDGDFNVGVSSEGELTRLIEARRDDGIYLSVLGFGMGNVKDNKMETLADHGNGNYAYIDSAQEARKVMVSQMAGTLHTIAKDVKIQAEFNPSQVKYYRLIGYENRSLENRDFNDDQKDAGEMGAGHSVTALYEIIPAGSDEDLGNIDPLRYQQHTIVPAAELLQLKVRYKLPGHDNSLLLQKTVGNNALISASSTNLRWAAAIAEYAMLLRNSEFKGQATYQQALDLAKSAKGRDEDGYKSELIRLMEVSQLLGE